MVKHIVMWKLKDYAEGLDKKENASKIKYLAESLIPKIELIRHLEVSINIIDSSDSYDIVLYSEFDSLEDLEKYQKHPEHIKIAEFISKVRLERKVTDYFI